MTADSGECHVEHSITPAAVRQAIETIYPGIGAWVCDEFESHSQKYFDGRLELRPILFGLTPHGKALGFYRVGAGHITLHTSLLKPAGRAWDLAPMLGLPPIHAAPIRQKRIDKRVCWHTPAGHLQRREMASWPHSVRPSRYYKDNR